MHVTGPSLVEPPPAQFNRTSMRPIPSSDAPSTVYETALLAWKAKQPPVTFLPCTKSMSESSRRAFR